MDNKKPSSVAQSGRRKSGGSTQLRSPVVKRPSTAPVSLQGWLHKQGSEGLMLWKKRWFVLSEYCLFYYKGPEEEKLLGSILLPSYKVSPCTADDKVYRKFAFKAEHANMRTYYFAAETRELMTQWMNALSLATILQEGGKLQTHIQPSVTSVATYVKQNPEDENCGFQGYRPRSGPITIQPTSQGRSSEEDGGNVNGWVPQTPGKPYQPLYANAPPKPKRLNNEGQYGGSSPEASPPGQDDVENIIYSNRRQFHQASSPHRDQDYHNHPYKPGSLPNPDIVRSIPPSISYTGDPLTERTPDHLVRSNISSPNFMGRIPKKGGEGNNYSDVFKSTNYNDGKPVRTENPGFLGYGKPLDRSVANYQHSNQYYQSYQQAPQMSPAYGYQDVGNARQNLDGRNRQPPRPHSADFLDYDAKRYYPNKERKDISEKSRFKSDQYNATRPPRPKSSLDIMYTNDGDYWSEERYAEKMRQSAMYLQNTLPQRSQSSRANTPSLKQISESGRTFVDYRNGKSEQIPVVMRQKREEDVSRDVTRSPSRQNLRRWSEHQDRLDNYFVRSASARLPKQRTQDDESDEVQAYTGGEDFNEERKEDSMKRLLEWKQRMLQSPLNRKSSGSSTRGVAQNELSKYYKQQVLKELERQEAKSREEIGKKRMKGDGTRIQNLNTDGRKSAGLPSDRYYNYSSDDEASGSGSVMRESHLPHSASTSPQTEHQIRAAQKAPTQALSSPSALTKDENLTNHKLNPSYGDFTERIDYYDRGKTYPITANGFPEWSDSYSERRDLNGGEELIKSYSGRGRPISESDYFLDQYQERKGNFGYSGTLPMVKGGGSVPMPSINLQGSSVGRSVGTLDNRYTGKENILKRVSSNPWGLDVSAGELLGRTHEELVLLLIQLRRQSASVCKAMEACHIEIEEQGRLAELDTPKRMEHIRKLERLKKHLLELEKQYEKGKPLVNLVDNMVKLGSLYRGNNNVYNGSIGLDYSPNVREKLEFNQKVQEQRLLAEERRDWDRLSPDHGQLQAKVQQLYRLDRLLQEESGTLHSLQQDKELLEKALGGLRHKLQINRSNPVEADRYRKQQKLLEKELSRVRLLLAHNSKKLEETVAENARLEQELVILRQKLQASRVSSRSSVPLVPESSTLSTTAALEAELRRVQQLVGDLQRQRHELSAQVKQLTEKSDTLVQQIRPGPTGVAGAGPIPGKKKSSATWFETDLDLLVTQDVGIESPVTSPQQQQQQPPVVSMGSRSTTPIYINTETSKKDVIGSPEELKSPDKITTPSSSEETQIRTYCTPVELSEADERMKRFYGIIPREKQEIKTVRIVKRESERRQRDRDRSGNIGIPIASTAVAKRVSVIEENDGYGLGRVEEECVENFHSSSGFNETEEDYQKQKPVHYIEQEGSVDPYMNFHPTNPFLPHNLQANAGDISPLDRDSTSLPSQRSSSLPRGFGKSSPVQPMKSEGSAALRTIMSKRNRVRGSARSRDDLDMERALRPRINAPDVVRSTMNHKDLKYNESTIDNILGTPNKIIIPERYIPEQEPILTAEEQMQRLRKAESIRKMLSETTALSTPDLSGDGLEEEKKSCTLRKKVEEEKKQREHLLELNQILAQQVMEKSKLVAVKALAALPLDKNGSVDDDDLSPIQPLPIYQQRENFFS